MFLLNPSCLSKVPIIVLIIFLITDYHCHLLSSICYCTNDELNPFKQHLNQWHKLQLLQVLSPLISNRFSNQNQNLPPAFFYILISESHQMSSENKPQTSKTSFFRQEVGEWNKKRRGKHNRRKQTRKDKFLYSEVRTKRYADVFSSLPFPGDRYVRALKALAV